VCDDEDLDLIFTWRERRKVSHALTLQYDKTIYLLPDTSAARRLIHKYIEVYEYPDGRIGLRADSAALPYSTYDRLPQVDLGAIVENKRLGHTLQIAQLAQEKRLTAVVGPRQHEPIAARTDAVESRARQETATPTARSGHRAGD
jgi:hypothetical protein